MSHHDYYKIGHPAIRTVEECAELIHAISKAERFGWENYHPNTPDRTNRDAVLEEIADVQLVCAKLKGFLENDDIPL